MSDEPKVLDGSVELGNVIDKVAESAAEAPQILGPGDTITLSTGVKLRLKKAPPALLVHALARFPRPKPPMLHDPKMGRKMENPADPEYVERLGMWQVEYGDALMATLILYGTELDSVPKGIEKPSGNGWLSMLELTGIETRPEDEHWRYLQWVFTVAAPNSEDINLISTSVGRLNAVAQSDVERAASFRGSNGRK